jgi:two-component system OmpR family sensor kinase
MMAVRRTRGLSDRRRLLASLVGLMIITTLAIGYFTVRATRQRLVARTDDTLRTQLTAAKFAINQLTPDMLASLNRLGSITTRDIGYTTIAADGHTIGSAPTHTSGPADPLPILPPASALKTRAHAFTVTARSGERYRAEAAPLGNGQTIVAFTPLATVDRTINDLRTTTIIIGLVAIVALAIVAWLILAAVTRPTESMIDVATAIGSGDLTARLQTDDLHGDARRLADALNQMVTRLEAASAARAESDERLRQFVADASHELRTPLTNIRGYAQLMLVGAADEDRTLALERINSETTHMRDLIEDLLLLTQTDQGQPIRRANVDVVALLRELATDAAVVDPDRPITTVLPTEGVIVSGDAHELRQAFRNLLANVQIHTDNDVPCRISVAGTPAEVCIEVADQGPGMDATEAEHAFDRFFRADAARSRTSGGSGLGLAIAKSIVEAHGGSITLTSRPGLGTTVRAVLPRTASGPDTLAPTDTTTSEPTRVG